MNNKLAPLLHEASGEYRKMAGALRFQGAEAKNPMPKSDNSRLGVLGRVQLRYILCTERDLANLD